MMSVANCHPQAWHGDQPFVYHIHSGQSRSRVCLIGSGRSGSGSDTSLPQGSGRGQKRAGQQSNLGRAPSGGTSGSGSGPAISLDLAFKETCDKCKEPGHERQDCLISFGLQSSLHSSHVLQNPKSRITAGAEGEAPPGRCPVKSSWRKKRFWPHPPGTQMCQSLRQAQSPGSHRPENPCHCQLQVPP